MVSRIRLRMDTAANWTAANPVLALGEPSVEMDTGKVKYGDGITAWTALSYSAASTGATGPQGFTGSAGAIGASGAVGFTGSAGAIGASGAVGFTGSIGANGATGPQGFTGSAGANGVLGATGPQGFTGSAGANGVSGVVGFTGSAGANGASGAVGFTGSAGTSSASVAAFVNAGTFVTMDNIRATVTTSGQRGLSLATVTGSFIYNIGGTFAGSAVGSSGTSLGGQTLTTTPTSSIFGWGFTVAGDIATYIITNTSSLQAYRITVQIGASYNNNMISIERLV